MLALENHCVECPTCSVACNAKQTEVHYCDICDDPAEWDIDDIEFCEKCAKTQLTEAFWDIHTIKSAAKYLDMRVNKI